jgi:hypothetical protein
MAPTAIQVEELKNYAAHAAVQTQITAFQTNITTTANLFILATGGIWAVIIPNSFNLDDWVLIAGLVLHLILALMTWWALGTAANQII